MSTSSSSNDLRNRILFTIFILAVYRFGTFVPLPGIDPEQLKVMMDGNQKGLLGMFNVFAGGAVSRMAILLTAPPANTLNIPSNPFWLPSIITFSCSGSIPGNGTKVPNL